MKDYLNEFIISDDDISLQNQSLSYQQGCFAVFYWSKIHSHLAEEWGILFDIFVESGYRKYDYVWDVFVESGYRHQGIGSNLTKKGIDYLRSLKFDWGCTSSKSIQR